ncbi:hypothetical protein [Pseudomonas aeruginosa]|uniref:hypothetical protein n=1 Tax=Pseudomonas aeruginosa TaxID=287 RepID=UPI0030D32381|nr:hypothetical protein [Pseudomonas aeruginosa]
MNKRVVKYRLGGSKVVWSDTVIVPDGVTVEFEVVVDDDDVLPVTIDFISEVISDANGPVMRGTAYGNRMHMEFVNFDGDFSNSGLSVPQQIGNTDKGEPILFLSVISRMPGCRKLELAFLVGDVVLGGGHGSAK